MDRLITDFVLLSIALAPVGGMVVVGVLVGLDWLARRRSRCRRAAGPPPS